MARFEMGRTVGTATVVALLEEAGVSPQSLLERHHRGDWGDLTEDDRQRNEEALVEGGRLLSVYFVRDQKIYIITEVDRSVTTIMLASEY